MTVLIVGGDGLIARALRPRLQSMGWTVWRTSRRPHGGEDNVIELDLSRPAPASVPAGRAFDAAVLCAAVTSRRACAADPAGSRAVNVTGQAELARALAAGGAFVVQLSTNLVFDGCRPLPPEDAPPSPQDEYSRQKAALESILRTLSAVAIVRLTKVLAADESLIAGWRRDLKAGRPIRAFRDVPCSLLALKEVVDGLAEVVVRRAAGTWHFSNAEEFTYHDLGLTLAQELGVCSALVQAADGWLGEGPPPRHAALGTDRTAAALGLRFSPAAAIIRDLAQKS